MRFGLHNLPRPSRLCTWAAALLAVLWLAVSAGCAPRQKTPLRVFVAGSLIVPFGEIEKAYEAAHPDVDVLLEAHGSIEIIRSVTEIHERIDVVVPADHALIPMMMYETRVPETGEPYARWHMKFASNAIALAFTSRSQFADEIDAGNWHEIITRPGVRAGIGDPRLDPCGYRTLLALKLAESAYEGSRVFTDLILARFRNPVTVEENGSLAVIRVPEVLEARPQSDLIVRSSSTQLIGLLQSGDLDYAFEYESVIQQHGLRMVRLPDAVNLGSEAFAEAYSKVQVRIDSQSFLSVNPVFNGEVIGYGVTIPTNAPHPKEAEEFVAFLLGAEGRKIMEAHHHPFIDPVEASHYDVIPKRLQALCVPMP